MLEGSLAERAVVAHCCAETGAYERYRHETYMISVYETGSGRSIYEMIYETVSGRGTKPVSGQC